MFPKRRGLSDKTMPEIKDFRASFLLEAELSHYLRKLCIVARDQRAEVLGGEIGGRKADGLARIAEGLAKVTCPTLVVRGAESDVFHEEDAERLASRLPNGRYVTIPKAGHTVQGDNPKDLAAALREFLN